jgi:hypothetical protein
MGKYLDSTDNIQHYTGFNFGGRLVFNDGSPPDGTLYTIQCQLVTYDENSNQIGAGAVKIFNQTTPNGFQPVDGNYAWGFDISGEDLMIPAGTKFFHGFKFISATSTWGNVTLKSASGANPMFRRDGGVFLSSTLTNVFQTRRTLITVNGVDIIGSDITTFNFNTDAPIEEYVVTNTHELVVDHCINVLNRTFNIDDTVDVEIEMVNTPTGIALPVGTLYWGDGNSEVIASTQISKTHQYAVQDIYIISFETNVDLGGGNPLIPYKTTALADASNPSLDANYKIDPSKSSGSVSSTGSIIDETTVISPNTIVGNNPVKVQFIDTSVPKVPPNTFTWEKNLSGSEDKVLFSNDENPAHVFDGDRPTRGGIITPSVRTNTV